MVERADFEDLEAEYVIPLEPQKPLSEDEKTALLRVVSTWRAIDDCLELDEDSAWLKSIRLVYLKRRHAAACQYAGKLGFEQGICHKVDEWNIFLHDHRAEVYPDEFIKLENRSTAYE